MLGCRRRGRRTRGSASQRGRELLRPALEVRRAARSRRRTCRSSRRPRCAEYLSDREVGAELLAAALRRAAARTCAARRVPLGDSTAIATLTGAADALVQLVERDHARRLGGSSSERSVCSSSRDASAMPATATASPTASTSSGRAMRESRQQLREPTSIGPLVGAARSGLVGHTAATEGFSAPSTVRPRDASAATYCSRTCATRLSQPNWRTRL